LLKIDENHRKSRILNFVQKFGIFPLIFKKNGGHHPKSCDSELSESAIRSKKCSKLEELGQNENLAQFHVQLKQ
jgi:hypothetical protein